ncbi:hypothetical protein EOA86_25240 [Mesorhizobium sp. M5C.F.Ca.IN.020.32.2.1]|nr:hypothetical protein EOA86_25240 [Mesorhizobium sp. M5C.F.Ca.IN.020.32.2.1]TIX77612.1 MAG: hypothetical protein E5V27_26890 [Mesorhizobium sp.]
MKIEEFSAALRDKRSLFITSPLTSMLVYFLRVGAIESYANLLVRFAGQTVIDGGSILVSSRTQPQARAG